MYFIYNMYFTYADIISIVMCIIQVSYYTYVITITYLDIHYRN